MGLFGRRKDTKAKVGDMLSRMAGAPAPPVAAPAPKPTKRGKGAKGAAAALARIQASNGNAMRPAAPAPRPAQPRPVAPAPRRAPTTPPQRHVPPARPAAPAAKPVQAKPVQAQPVQAKPVQAKPVQAQPVQAKPVAQAKPVIPTEKPAAQPAQPAAPTESSPWMPTAEPAAEAPVARPAAPVEAAPAPSKPAAPAMDPALMERLAALEKGMSGLKNVQDLSELLSTKYNPFLDVDEEELFEGKHSTGELIRARMGQKERKPAWAQASPGFIEAWHDLPATPAPQPMAQQAPMQPPAPAPQPYAQVPAAAPVPAQTSAAETSPRRFKDVASHDGEAKTMYGGNKRSSANARESFLAMHWFTYLSEGTSPSIIFLYLDYYRYVGWIDEDSYEWLWKLGEGVAAPKDGAAWEDYGMDVQRLSSQHLRNLRFIDKLLGTTLQHGEADYLRQTADMLLMED